jgi:hypothetical protein
MGTERVIVVVSWLVYAAGVVVIVFDMLGWPGIN